MYTLHSNIDPNKIFIINRSQLEGKLEAQYYQPEITKLEEKIRSKTNLKLKDFVLKLSSGATPSVVEEEKFYSDKENGVPFLRVQNLQANSKLNIEDVKFINQETHEKYLKRSQVSEGDLLVKITGVGRMAIGSVAPDGFVGNTNQHMAVIKTESKEVSQYLANYLNLDIIEKLATRRATGGTRPALDYPALKSIPIIKNIDFSILEKAEINKQQKETEAKKLLESIDTYLLKELGIALPEKDNSLTSRVFTTKFSEISGIRFDAFAILNKDFKIEGGFYPDIRLKLIANLNKGQSITSDKIINGDVPVIAGGQSSPYNHYVCNYIGNVITISASGAYAGYVWYHNSPIFASDCTVAQSKNENEVITLYLFEILKTKQQEIYHLQQGAGQPHVYSRDLEKLNIPVPPIKKQIDIVNHIQEIRNQAKQLQDEALLILDRAKQEVEKIILS